jgi:polyketide cyclase/dehydrase/lipid transport protein
MLPYLLIGLVVVVVLFVIIVASRPAEFRVERSGIVAAPPEAVFPHVNDFHNWDAWSPWAKIDPACRNTFDGPAAGVGAKFAWDGNNKVGSGRMTILESRPSERIRINLEFLKPFKATNIAEFTFRPEGGSTKVNWLMTGRNNFLSKAFGLFVNCDKMVGGQFEQGLANLNSVAGRK